MCGGMQHCYDDIILPVTPGRYQTRARTCYSALWRQQWFTAHGKCTTTHYKRTRHIDIKHFALLDWVEQDMLILQEISTHDNSADARTKPLTKNLFSIITMTHTWVLEFQTTATQSNQKLPLHPSCHWALIKHRARPGLHQAKQQETWGEVL